MEPNKDITKEKNVKKEKNIKKFTPIKIIFLNFFNKKNKIYSEGSKKVYKIFVKKFHREKKQKKKIE